MDFERKGTRPLFFKATADLNFELRNAGYLTTLHGRECTCDFFHMS